MRTRVDAMLQAVQVARPALDKFYQSLSDEQKERFNVIDQEVESTDQRQADIAGLCQRTRRNAGPLLDRTEHILRLSNNQDAALKDLKEASAKAAGAAPLQLDSAPYNWVIKMKPMSRQARISP